MPRILVLGATGTVGGALADSLLRSGEHIVYGLARTPEKANALRAQEIIPVAGSDEDSAAYLALIRSAPIDIVVDAAGANKGSAKILEDVKAAGADRLATAKAAGTATPKLGFVYVSGMWVHGNSPDATSDLDPVGAPHSKAQPPALVAWRPALEQAVLAARDVLDSVVVRPSLVYGRSGAIWSSWFAPIVQAAKEGKQTATITARPGTWLGLAHVDDIASGLHAVIEKLPSFSSTGVYPVFDLITSRERLSDVLEGAAESLGFGGKLEYADPAGNPFAEALSTSFSGFSSSRAKQILGWQPKRLGMLTSIDVYGKAWLAAQQ